MKNAAKLEQVSHRTTQTVRSWSMCPAKGCWGSGLLQAGEEMALGHLTSACSIYKDIIKKTAPGSFCRCTDRERDKWSKGQLMKERMLWLDKKINHDDSLSLEVVKPRSLEVCDTQMDKALSSLVWIQCQPFFEQEDGLKIPEVPELFYENITHVID